jgi:hypothetical protein
MDSVITPLHLLGMILEEEDSPNTEVVPLEVLRYILEDYIERHRIACDANTQMNVDLAFSMEESRELTRSFLIQNGFPKILGMVDEFLKHEDKVHETMLRDKLKEVGDFN